MLDNVVLKLRFIVGPVDLIVDLANRGRHVARERLRLVAIVIATLVVVVLGPGATVGRRHHGVLKLAGLAIHVVLRILLILHVASIVLQSNSIVLRRVAGNLAILDLLL